MDAIMKLAAETAPWVWLLSGFVLTLTLAVLVWELAVRFRFRRIIRKTLEGCGGNLKPVSPLILKLHVRWLERLAKKKGIPIMEIFDFRHAWLDKFKSGRRRKDMYRLLDFYPDFALFPCFEEVLHNKKRGEDFRLHLITGGDDNAFFLLKRLGMSCAGRDFDAAAAYTLLADHIGSLRELSGDAEWPVRDFAVQVLLADADAQSHRLLWEALGDSHSHIRATVAKKFRPGSEDRSRLYELLFRIFLKDPQPSVRAAAKNRIHADFTDLYKLSLDSLDDEDVLHALALLDTGSKEDENLAFTCLDDSDPERRLAGARFLQRSGALERIFLGVDFGDREILQRTRDRLEKAVGASVTGFLSASGGTNNPASLFLALAILQKKGDRTLIAPAVRKVFALISNGKDPVELLELYQTALRALKARGTPDTAVILLDELQRRKNDEILRSLIWENLPGTSENLFVDELARFLKEGNTSPKDIFLAAWKNFSTELCLPPLLDLLTQEDEISMTARQDILTIVSELRLPGLLQFLLESLPLLPDDDIPAFCAQLASCDEKLFLARAGTIIRSVDARSRAAMFLGLTSAGKKTYLKDIREALNDSDPEVRLAAFISLSEYDEAKVLNTNAVKLIRDPVDRVRRGVAKALGRVGSETTIEELKNLVTAKDEVASVRTAGILGLGESGLESAVDALLEIALAPPEENAETAKACTAALAQKTDKKQILYMIEKFKDGNSPSRALLASAFTAMGENGEEVLMELLKEDIASLKPFICEALEATGLVDIFIRRLGNRDPSVRREAAGQLISIGTTKAFKGIVEAARDPDAEIRVLVTRALESLNTPAGEGILKELENDPDKRVRRYTAWAMERIKAKGQPG